MSKSTKKTPILPYVDASEKRDKQKWHRKMRRQVKEMLDSPDEDTIYPEERDCWNPWTGSKDGKHWVSDRILKPGWLRK